ncbi:MAG: YkgJ family cysteine cluster protein [Candidatus Scalinduaceae bacterium]
MHVQRHNQPWYKDGLRFECQRCGRCCRGEPGMVWMDKKEIRETSSFLGITQDIFAKLYLRIVSGRFSLLEHNNGDCVMYDDGCKIYSVRPSQCKTFPFWKSNLENGAEWEKLMNTCPGIGKGRLHTLNDIENYLKPELSKL